MSVIAPGVHRVAPLGASGIAAGSVTSPAAGQNIAISPSAIPAGMYEIELEWVISGTPEVAPMNMSWATVAAMSPSTFSLPTVPGSYSLKFVNVQTATAQLLFRVGATTPTVGAIYTAILRWTLIG